MYYPNQMMQYMMGSSWYDGGLFGTVNSILITVVLVLLIVWLSKQLKK